MIINKISIQNLVTNADFGAFLINKFSIFHFPYKTHFNLCTLRFAHLFISPLFTETALEREVLAVESEHQKYISDDWRRIERVIAQTGKPGHPFGRYRTGKFKKLKMQGHQFSHEKFLNMIRHHIL